MARLVYLRTQHQVIDCQQRLAWQVAPLQHVRTFGDNERERAILRAGGDPTIVRGTVGARAFWLVRTGPVRNSFTSLLRGSLIDRGDHTLVEARLEMATAVVVFSTIWLGIASLFVVIALVETLRVGVTALPLLGIGLVFPLFFAVLFTVGRRRGRRDEEYLIAFVCRLLEAHPVAAQLPPHRPYRGGIG